MCNQSPHDAGMAELAKAFAEQDAGYRNEGVAAFHAGKPIDSNPYPFGTSRWLEHRKGWSDAAAPRSYRTEFPDFDPATMPIIPAWLDTSWHNDTCPSFQSGALRIFVDYADPQQREVPESARYSVHANDNAVAVVFFYADDWPAIVAFVDAYEGRAA